MQTKINCLEQNLHLTRISLTRCEKVIMLTASLLKKTGFESEHQEHCEKSYSP